MNNLIIANNYETFGEEGLTSNKVIYYKEDNMVKFRANITDDPYGESEVITVGGETSSIINQPITNQYLTFYIVGGNGTITFTPTAGNENKLWYNKGKKWINGNTIDVEAGDIVIFKGEGFTPIRDKSNGGIGQFSSTTQYAIYGNILSLYFGDDYINNLSEPMPEYGGVKLFRESPVTDASYLMLPSTTASTYSCSKMFEKCANLIKAPNLPATTLQTGCYNDMFANGCSSLLKAPDLPATTLADSCYRYMFKDCVKFTKAPELPATNINYECYCGMFQNCTSLVKAPELPATTLKGVCYADMFAGCSSLEIAPILPATTLVGNRCYQFMFGNCPKLKYVKALFTTPPSGTYTFWMFHNSGASNAVFVQNENATWVNQPTANYGIPNNFRIIKESDETPLYLADSHQMVATYEDDTTLTTKIYTKP